MQSHSHQRHLVRRCLDLLADGSGQTWGSPEPPNHRRVVVLVAQFDFSRRHFFLRLADQQSAETGLRETLDWVMLTPTVENCTEWSRVLACIVVLAHDSLFREGFSILELAPVQGIEPCVIIRLR